MDKGKDKGDAHHKEKTTDLGKRCDRSVTPENLLVDYRIDCHLHVDAVKGCCRNGVTIGPIIVELDAV